MSSSVAHSTGAPVPQRRPGIMTTLIGSYPVPAWLTASPSRQGVRDATTVVLHGQEQAGLDLLVDGELSRFDINHPETNGMIEYFVRPMDGIRNTPTLADLEDFRGQSHTGFRRRPPGVVVGPVGEGALNLPDAYAEAAELTSRPLKFTLTSPYMLARMLLDKHYGDLAGLTLALADVLAAQVARIDAPVVQVDEANLPGRPEDAELAAEAINRVLGAVKGVPAVHLCFGNYGGQRIQSGTWDRLLPFFERLRADHVLLEGARIGAGHVEQLRELPAHLRLGLGVVDVKTTVVETAEEVARRIEDATRILGGAERIAYVHPDCGFWMLARSIADSKIVAVVAGRDLYEGRPARTASDNSD